MLFHVQASLITLLWTLVQQSAGPCEEVVILYHYTNELAFRNVGNLEQTAAQVFASLEKRAHFGDGVYATQHEPADTWLK